MSTYETKFNSAPLDIGKLRPVMQDERRDLVFLMRQSECAERYEDMCALARRLALLVRGNMTREERNLFAIAHKQVGVAKRAAWRALANPISNQKLNAAYRGIVENEVRTFCESFNTFVLTEVLRHDIEAVDHRVFFLKLVADHYRYLAELDPEREQANIKSARGYYQDGQQLAESLPTTDPIRLGLLLNFSVFLYEISRDAKGAYEMAKLAFDKAINKLDELDEEDYKDATLVMQLMRDNLALWVSLDQAAQAQ